MNNVTTDSFQAEVLEADKVLVDFYADWCGPCKAVSPVLEKLAKDHDLKIVKVDIDAEGSLASDHGVLSIPTIVMFEAGQETERVTGAFPKKILEQKLHIA